MIFHLEIMRALCTVQMLLDKEFWRRESRKGEKECERKGKIVV